MYISGLENCLKFPPNLRDGPMIGVGKQLGTTMLQPVADSAYGYLSSLHGWKELHMESPRVLAVLKFKEVLDVIMRVQRTWLFFTTSSYMYLVLFAMDCNNSSSS